MSLFESTEDLELLPITEIIDDSVIPLEEYSEEETQELAPEASENLEGFSSKLETTEMVTDLEMIEGIADATLILDGGYKVSNMKTGAICHLRNAPKCSTRWNR